MQRILDKTIIYISCAAFYVFLMGISAETIVILLLSILMACSNILLEQFDYFLFQTERNLSNSTYSQVIYAIFALILFLKPSLVVFVPILLYDGYRHKQKISPILCGVLLLYRAGSLDGLSFFVLLFICTVSLMLSSYGSRLEMVSQKVISLRDDSVEHSRLMEANNKMLVEKQNSAIYTATLQERNRIAREIHDNVGHLLTRSILQTGAIKTINQAENLKAPIEMLNETLNTAMTSIRNSVHDLHDESVDLKGAIEDILSNVKNFEIAFDYDVENYINRDIKYAFIAITKEAVNNCMKHSNGDKLHILLREHPGFYQLMIEDNGTQARISQHSGIGLSNITERANAIHGTAKFFTDSGFRILITVLKEEK